MSLPPPKLVKTKAPSAPKEKTESKEVPDSPPTTAKETKTAKTAKAGTKAVSKKGTSRKGKEAEEDHHSRGGPPCSRGRRMNRTSMSVLCGCVCTSVYKTNVSSYTCCSYMYVCMYVQCIVCFRPIFIPICRF